MDQFNYQSLSGFKQRPSENIRYLICRQLPKLIDIAISDTLEFINTTQTKQKALKQLKYTILIGEGAIDSQLEKIMRALVKIWQMEIEGAEKIICEIMVIIGYHLSSNFYLPLMMNLLQSEEMKNSQKNTIILLKLISYMLQKTEDISTHLDELMRLIAHYEALLLENDDGLSTVSQIVMNLISRLVSIDQPQIVSTLFSVLLNVQATKTIPAETHQKVHESMKMLAKKAGYSSVADLHSFEVGPTLTNLVESKEYMKWNKTTKNRFKFDAIVRNCEGEAIKFLSDILTVMEYCITLECDVEIRMDTLVLLEAMMENEHVKVALRDYSMRIMLKILNVAVKWKVGKPQIKIRKAGIINMIKLIEEETITPEQLLDCQDELLPQIKTCITDDWAPELRLACCEFLEKFMMATREVIDGDQLKQFYVMLLERLDDSQDPIRKKTTTALNIFFMAKCLSYTVSISSVMEYMITAIFVHFDDANPEIRDSINITLRYAARVDAKQVLKNAEINLKRMKHSEQCRELVEFCKELMEESKI